MFFWKKKRPPKDVTVADTKVFQPAGSSLVEKTYGSLGFSTAINGEVQSGEISATGIAAGTTPSDVLLFGVASEPNSSNSKSYVSSDTIAVPANANMQDNLNGAANGAVALTAVPDAEATVKTEEAIHTLSKGIAGLFDEKTGKLRGEVISVGNQDDTNPFAGAEKEAAERWPDIPAPPKDPELVKLREMVFQREISILNVLKARLDNPADHAKDVSAVIAEALILRSAKDERLSRALEPVVDGILRQVMRKSPRDFANIIFPMMGPAIRRSIAEGFRGMLENFNKTLELSFSWQGLRWRLEALTSGKPFSEVVLLHTLIYRVEEIFFIHSDTGLPLARVVRDDVDVQDSDLVSGMLTAVQQFVADCFNRGNESELESVKWGEYTIMVEKNPYASLACVVYGQPPADFRERLRESLEHLLIEHAEALANFKGDIGQFASATVVLEKNLTSHFAQDDKPIPFWVRLLPWVFVLALLLCTGYYFYTNIRDANDLAAHSHQMNDAVALLRDEPGYMVTSVVENGMKPWEVVCVKDELARDVSTVLSAKGFLVNDIHVRVSPYISLEPNLVEKRVSAAIDLPDTAEMEYLSNGTLKFNGTAPMEWILQIRQEALSLPGVKYIDMRNLSDPRMVSLVAMVRKVEGIVVEFPMGKDTPVPEGAKKLAEAVTTLVAIEKLARQMGLNVNLTIYGHADTVGSDARNYEISQARVRTLAAMLYSKGSSIPIAMYGMGAEFASDETSVAKGDQSSRRIEMRVHLTQAGDATPEALKK